MRADAVRRREALLAAALDLVAARGAEVPLEAVAERAGVGIATLYRNFGSREVLLNEVALSALEGLDAAIETARVVPDVELAQAWQRCIETMLSLQVGALTAALGSHVGAGFDARVRHRQADVLAHLDELLGRAQRQGLVRGDLSAVELVVLLGMATQPLPEGVRHMAPQIEKAVIRVVLDGLAGPK